MVGGNTEVINLKYAITPLSIYFIFMENIVFFLKKNFSLWAVMQQG